MTGDGPRPDSCHSRSEASRRPVAGGGNHGLLVPGRRRPDRSQLVGAPDAFWVGRRYANLDENGDPYRYIPPKDVLNSKSDGRYVTQDRRSAWWDLDLIDFSPALRPDYSETVFEEPLDDESDWGSGDISAALDR